MKAFTLHLHYIYITFTLHLHYIYITFTLHLHYIYITFTLHLHYIYITFTYIYIHIHIYIYMYIHININVNIYISRCDSVGSFIDSQSPTSKPIASQGTMLLPFYEVFTNVRVSPFVSVSLFELLLIQRRSASGLFFPTSFLGLCAYWSLSGRIFILVNDGQYLLLGSWTLCLVHF